MNREKLKEKGAWFAPTASFEQKRLPPLLILAFIALLFLPFCNKALHIDDMGFLDMARVLGWNPLITVNPGIYESTHSPLFSYLYKILIAVFGLNEIGFHLVFLVFPIISVFSLGSLNRNLFQPNPVQEMMIVLLFGTLPAFLVNAQNLMADVPALAFVLLAMASYTTAIERGNIKFAYFGGVSLCLAVLIAYQAAVFIPLVLLYILTRKKLQPHFLASLSIAPIIVLAWLLLVYQQHDVFPFLKNRATASIATVVTDGFPLTALQGKLVFLLAMTGASMLPALLLRLLVPHIRKGTIWQIAVLIPLSFVALTFATEDYALGSRLALACFVACGVFALATVFRYCFLDVRENATRSRGVLLLLWITGVLLYNLFLLPFGSARYLLPALPPLLMILLHHAPFSFTGNRLAAGGIFVLSLVLGLSCAFADYRLAGSYREIAAEVKDLRTSGGNAYDVWFVGDWGMRYYLEEAGARFLPPQSNEPRRGDFIILPELPRFSVPSHRVQYRSRSYATRDFASKIPVHIFNRRSKSGFYSHYAGLLPLAFSREPIETFTILEVIQ